MAQVDRLLARQYCVGMAVVMGEINADLVRHLRFFASQLTDYVAWATLGPIMIVVFNRTLYEEVAPIRRALPEAAPGLVAGIAFSHEFESHKDLLLVARVAMCKAFDHAHGFWVLEGADSSRALRHARLALEMRKPIEVGDVMGIGAVDRNFHAVGGARQGVRTTV